MVEQYFVAKNLKIKKEGIIDFDVLYKSTKKFLEDYGFKEEYSLEKKFIEELSQGG